MKDTVCFSNQNCCHPCIFSPYSHTILNIQRNCCCILQQYSQNWICKLIKLKQYSISTFFLSPIEATHTEKFPVVFLNIFKLAQGIRMHWSKKRIKTGSATSARWSNRKIIPEQEKAVIICLYFTSPEVNLQKMYNALACLFDV